jgi:hypothetical protein
MASVQSTVVAEIESLISGPEVEAETHDRKRFEVGSSEAKAADLEMAVLVQVKQNNPLLNLCVAYILKLTLSM